MPVARDAAVTSHLELLFAALPEANVAPTMLALDPDDSVTVDARLVSFLAAVTLNAIAASEGQLLLHAGAVARADGGCAVLCGPSGSGKTSLTAALVGSGLSYVADETLCMEPHSLRVLPFRRPLALKSGVHSVLGHLRPAYGGDATWVVPPASLGGAPLSSAPLQPELLIFPTYRPGLDCIVEPVSQAEAAFLAGSQSSRLQLTRGGPLEALARLARRAPAHRVAYSDLDAAVESVNLLWDAA